MSDNNSDANLMLERANAAVLSRDYSLATRLYRTLLQSDPDNVDLLFALGDLYQKSGNDAKAIPIYKRLIEKNPKDVVSMNFLGSIYRRIRQYDDSIDILEKAVIVDETNIQTFYNLGFTYKLMGKNEEAIQCFNTVVDENPNDVLAYNHIGSIYASENEHEKAVSAYQRGLKIDPNHPILHLNMARSYEKLDSDDLAAKEYEAALRSKPGWLDAIDGYADLLMKKKDMKAVSEMLSQAIRLNPQVASVHSKMGHLYDMQGNFNEAESEYTTALKINSKDFNTFADLAEALYKNGKVVDSIRTMKKGDELCADTDASFMARYADLMMSAEKLNAAGHKIKMLWEKNPDDISTLNLLGQYYVCRGEDAKAEGCFQKIKLLDPTALDYLVDSARRYNQVGRYGKGEQNARKYLHVDPNGVKALLVLAESLEKQNRIEEALDEYQKLAALDLENVFYKASLERLAQILENSEMESYESEEEGMYDREEAAEAMDTLESQLSQNDEDGTVYDSNAIMPSLDFSRVNEQRMAPDEMVRLQNQGYSFESLTQEDHSMESPFSPRVDEEIMAGNSSADDFDNLVPEPETEPDETPHEFIAGVPSDGTGMGSGPVEGLMSQKFLEEDIDGTRKVPDRTLDVSDGWDDADDELNSELPRQERPRPARQAAPANPPAPAEYDEPEISDGMEIASEVGTENIEAEPSYEENADFSMEESSETIETPSGEEEFVQGDDDGEVEMEGDEGIFTAEEDMDSEDMEFSDEELSDDSEMTVDQVSDGAEEVDDTDNGYGFSFEDDDGESIFEGKENQEEYAEDEPEEEDYVVSEKTVEPEPELSVVEPETEQTVVEPEAAVQTEVTEASEDNFVFAGEVHPAQEPESDGSCDAEIQNDIAEVDDFTFEDYIKSAEEDESADEENDGSETLDGIESDSEIDEESVADGEIESNPDAYEGIGSETVEATGENFDADEIIESETDDEVDSTADVGASESEPFFGVNEFETEDKSDDGDELRLSAELFIKLRDLSSYLPVDKKQKFLESRENLQLEYLIKKLSGEAGLLETAHDIRERLNLMDEDGVGLDADRTREMLSYMKSYIESLPDKNIAKSLESEVDAAIEKL